MLGEVFERFVDRSPHSVMLRVLLERVFDPATLDELFEQAADKQYQRKLLFSTVFQLMIVVVCGVHPSVHAAYQAAIIHIDDTTATSPLRRTTIFRRKNALHFS